MELSHIIEQKEQLVILIPPALHISTANPSYPSSLHISGARYAGVPIYSFTFFPLIIIFDTPNSHIYLLDYFDFPLGVDQNVV